MAKLLLESDEMITVTPEHGSKFKTDEIYNILKSTCVTYIPLGKDQTLIVDQEGMLKKNIKTNNLATDLARSLSIYKRVILVGHALMCKNKELFA